MMTYEEAIEKVSARILEEIRVMGRPYMSPA